ncbi:MAG: DNA mismatch repair endonuclease MutL [Deltaproteobacteria bacterium]|nr:DNA mismatch repair endonuclease MutL [Deltaproteobacteria bacterium]MCX7953299.1 DNA mismatch repair endonuclease MutL [Deltaproteobacteria bacterium]
MPSIKILHPELAAKIAAGEVIERPLSVVKECVENSIDAGAGEISVSIIRGGFEEITISDDGEGIPSNDIDLAVCRFATSKITSLEDLSAISTYGFRGEALYAICQVSELHISTRQKDKQLGCQAIFKFGQKTTSSIVSRSQGTTIKVKSLFENIPARLKFQASALTETRRIKNLLIGYSLVNKEIKFRLKTDHNEETFYGDESGLLSVFGDGLAAFEHSEGLITIRGLLGLKSLGSTGDFFVFVNKRPVTDRTILKAVKDSFGLMVKNDRDISGYIHVDLAPGLVDVNVHPRKNEVRFVNPNLIYRVIYNQLSKKTRNLIVSKGVLLEKRIMSFSFSGTNYSESKLESGNLSDSIGSDSATYVVKPVTGYKREKPGYFASEDGGLGSKTVFLGILGNGYFVYKRIVNDSLKVKEHLVIVDPHAAQERQIFDKIFTELLANKSRQRLVIPIEVPPALKDVAQDLSAYGFTFESTNDKVFLTEVPAVLLNYLSSEISLIVDSLYELNDPEINIESIVYYIASKLACHRSFRLGDDFTGIEAEMFFKSIESLETAYCPHGRPFKFELSVDRLDEFFQRTS